MARRPESARPTEKAAPDPAPALRLGIFPLAVLAAEFRLGTPLPFLVPIFAALLLLAGPRRPPLLLLVRLFALVMAVTFGLVWAFGAVADSPASVWLILLALVTLCFARLAHKPRDIAATLAVSVAGIVTVLLQVSPELPPVLPWLMGRSFVFGAATAWLAFALLPGRPAVARQPPPPAPPAEHDGLRIIAKGVALVAILALCILLEDTSAILIAMTVTTMLVAPDVAGGASVARLKLLSNLLALAAALPVLVLVALRPEPLAAALVALAACLAVAAGAGRGDARGAVTAMAMPVLLTLLGLYAQQAAEGLGVAAALGDRMVSLVLAVGYGLAVHVMLRRPASVPA